MIPKLKPCPFCGSSDLSLAKATETAGPMTTEGYRTGCRECCVSRFTVSGPAVAVANWNMRAKGVKRSQVVKSQCAFTEQS